MDVKADAEEAIAKVNAVESFILIELRRECCWCRTWSKEKVEGSSFLFDAQVSGPAITHLGQVPTVFWLILAVAIGAGEQFRAEVAFVDPKDVPDAEAGLMRADHFPGDIGFDPLGLKPEDPEEFEIMVTKELQHGRLAMLAAAGFMAQELADGKGIIEHLQSS